MRHLLFPLHKSTSTTISLSDTSLYLCYCRHTVFHTCRHCSLLHHSFGPYWRLRPSSRRSKSRVAQRLISADIHKISRERGTEHASVCYHIVVMVLRIWKHSRVSMTLPRQLGWLGETSQASWCIFLSLFFFFFGSFSSFSPLATPKSPPLYPSFFQACPQFSSLVFCSNEKFFPLLQSIR